MVTFEYIVPLLRLPLLLLLLQVYSKEPGNVSPRMAEMRADMGDAVTDLSQMQTFDGPAPETICGERYSQLHMPVLVANICTVPLQQTWDYNEHRHCSIAFTCSCHCAGHQAS